MRTVLQPKDLDISNFPERGDIAAWINQENVYYKCSHCEKWMFGEPTYYCPECGSMMVNAMIVKEEYKRVLESLKPKKNEEVDG